MRLLITVLLCALFAGCGNPGAENNQASAYPWALLPFKKVDSCNPVLAPDTAVVFTCPVLNRPVAWEAKDVFNPAALVRNDTVFLLYRAEDKIGQYAGTSRIGLAWSTDGLHFNRLPQPVLYPDNDSVKKYEWEGGCEDPRVVQDDKGVYYLTYTAYDGDKARLMVASSPDLLNWTKHGPAFAKALGGRYRDRWSKSGSIVCRYENGKAIAVKIGGHYWMYWGDTNIFLATSDDLVNWLPLLGTDGQPQVAFGPRKGKFDSDLVEPGPPAMLTDSGIVLIYNSRNVPARGDTSLAEGTYAPAQILFDSKQPGLVKARMEQYFMKPDKPYEINGQVNHVCFLEGLVHFKEHWYLYYGTADAKIAVAVK
ncbi:MAG TPA: glycoside hydrolase family 130 protein [Chitinophagaceae bacterium]|jgi:predicted GH43/DUF377 family glycosyl hydrolase|nr:glycoside hydrolase family 130 protein [Chitinophagaceae bacterium]